MISDDIGEISVEMSAGITGLPEVSYGRSGKIINALNIKELTGNATGIKCVDLKKYTDLITFGSNNPMAPKEKNGGVFINLYKTMKTDPDNIYLAISRDIDDSTLIHEIAHALDYLGGSKLMPGTLQPLSLESEIPVDHLEHPEEFGYWLDYLKKRFDVQLDADDTIVSYLFENGLLIKGAEIHENNILPLKSKSDKIFRFLNEKGQEINALIRKLPGYIGTKEVKD